ncbi:helix-turn-helix domain-containing protein [Altererythrobacter lutimaris]|uniref:AraC family transcriptional regulator n=1 Tax=Altererythrobacter lutimaris TaxID=2743979 RepID=A0A850HC71_9SPHN|nr:helix-turn-helix domain-containing protein [Altererythrobacter lutimaris]NVE95359.1 AraC family transcriptional regulator [Altererythrobacter lutimaris]
MSDSLSESALDAAVDASELDLTPPSAFQLDYIAPPLDLSDYVTTFYHFRCDEAVIRDIQPAAIGHLTFFMRGKGEMHFADGRRDPSNLVNLLTPFSRAAPFEVEGPFHSIGAALSPLGWSALTGLHAGEHGNRLYPAGLWLGEEITELGVKVCAAYNSGAMGGQDCVDALSEFIRATLRPVNSRHRELIRQVNRWVGEAIDPDVGTLMERVAYSERQTQRLTEQYFGLPPRALARKYRALRAATLLSLPMLSDEMEAQIGEAFYDQPHMIREIRVFAGRTPARLSDEENPFLAEMLDTKNLREIGMPDGEG